MAVELKVPTVGESISEVFIGTWLKNEGDTVEKGQRLLTLEAMKMEHGLTAPFDGVVAEVSATAGQQVQVEALLAKVEKSE